MKTLALFMLLLICTNYGICQVYAKVGYTGASMDISDRTTIQGNGFHTGIDFFFPLKKQTSVKLGLLPRLDFSHFSLAKNSTDDFGYQRTVFGHENQMFNNQLILREELSAFALRYNQLSFVLPMTCTFRITSNKDPNKTAALIGLGFYGSYLAAGSGNARGRIFTGSDSEEHLSGSFVLQHDQRPDEQSISQFLSQTYYWAVEKTTDNEFVNVGIHGEHYNVFHSGILTHFNLSLNSRLMFSGYIQMNFSQFLKNGANAHNGVGLISMNYLLSNKER